MKYYKFEKIKKGKYPIIKVTFKTWWGKEVVRDVCQIKGSNLWHYMDNSDIVVRDEPIKTFYRNDDDTYCVN